MCQRSGAWAMLIVAGVTAVLLGCGQSGEEKTVASPQAGASTAGPLSTSSSAIENPGLVLVTPPLLVVDASGNASAVLILKSLVDKKTLALAVSDFGVGAVGAGEISLGTVT